jgi:FkbM family methyltransferase
LTPSDDRRLSVHHIGGRAGSRTFPVLSAFERDVVNVLYDADPDCVEQVREANAELTSELHVLPYCFAGARGRRDFSLNYDPYTSGLLPSNPALAGWYHHNGECDYVWGEATRPMEERVVDTVTLDEVFSGPGGWRPPPDVLSIDTQGAELEILQGGEQVVRDSAVAVLCEVEFLPLYRDQPLFGDVSAHLFEQGFRFAQFSDLYELSPERRIIGARAHGFHAFGEAVFLKDAEQITDDPVRLRKLAFVAIVLGHLEYGLGCLDRAGGVPPARLGYERFLAELTTATEALPQAMPQTFAQRYSFEDSSRRFAPREARHAAAPRPRLLESPIRWVGAKARGTRLEPVLVSLYSAPRRAAEAVRRHSPSPLGRTPVETTLVRWGLTELAALVRERRLAEEPLSRR